MGLFQEIMDGAASAPISDVARERLGGMLEWRCRRGMKELDFLLLRYLRDRHAAAASDERAAFVEFLELPDPDIARYLLAGDVPPDPRHAALCRVLLTN
jgi:antitoxin CptB